MKALKQGVYVLLFIMASISIPMEVNAQQNDDNNAIVKKYTNADFYKNGVFQKDAAKKAIKEMLLAYGELYTAKIDSEI